MRFFLFLWAVVLAGSSAYSQAITSTVCSWTYSPLTNPAGYEERTLLEGSTRDYSHLIVQAITLPTSQPAQPTQQLDEEAILIIRAGELTLSLGGKRRTLGPGSVVLVMPGDEYRVENKGPQPLSYYRIRYTSNEMPDLDLYRLAGSSFWVDWQEVATIADQQGGCGRMVACASVMSSRITMQVATLDAGPGVRPLHTHRTAEILVVLDRPVQAHIERALTGVQAGDLIFVESNVSHGLDNDGQEGSTWLSIQF